MKKRIAILEQNDKRQQETMRIQDEEKRKMVKELETCRISAIKEVSKANDSFAKKIAEMKKMYEVENERKLFELKNLQEKCHGGEQSNQELKASLQQRSSQIESLTLELKAMQENNEQITLNLKTLQEKSDNVISKLEEEHKTQVESLTHDFNKLQQHSNDDAKVKHELEQSLQECSSRVELLANELQNLQEQTIKDAKSKQELEASLKERSSQLESIKLEMKSAIQAKLEESGRQAKDLEGKSSEVVSLSQTVKTLEVQIKELKQLNKEEASQWSKKVKECKEEISQLSDKLEISISRHAAITKERGELLEKLNSTKRKNVSLRESLGELGKDKASDRSDFEDLTRKLEKKINNERALRGEVAQKKQMIAILQSNEKHLEEHVACLEEQINKLVSDYESKLQVDVMLKPE
mmetsp:Transcript_18107/g.38060  ORF Transcript_18107/g.38060 Transcript_18107/m.38060 type:complete len:411 (+) Transcript_18107:2-1234(+)